ncbi:nucleic acid-binding, OB-fold protein [Tanacetum coccineum]
MLIVAARNQRELLLNQLQLGMTGTIMVMICRMWDVNAATGRYLSTEFIIFDVEPNKDKFCVMRYADFMLEFDGATTVRKYFVKSEGFISSLLMVTMFLNSSGVEMMKETLSAANTEVKAGTLENLLMWAYNQKYDVGHLLFDIPLLKIDRVRTKRGWNYPSCRGEKCKKSMITRKEGHFWCNSCNNPMEYPVLRHMLELEVSDDIAEAVVMTFDETASTLVKLLEIRKVSITSNIDSHSL